MTATNPSNPPTIAGNTYPATRAGFVAFLDEANRVRADGYELVTLVRLERAIAAVYRRKADGATTSGDRFFEDE